MRKNKTRGWIVVFTIVTIISILVGFNYYVKYKLLHQIQALSDKTVDGLYQIKIGETQLDVWSGILEANDITITTDSVQWKAWRDTAVTGFPARITAHLQSLKFRNFSWLGYFSRRNIGLNTVIIEQPQIQIFQYAGLASKEDHINNILSRLPGLLSPVAEELHIKYLNLTDGQIDIVTIAEKDSTVQHLSDIDFKIRGLNISRKNEEISFCNEIMINTGRYEITRASSDYRFSFDALHLEKKDSLAEITGIELKPIISAKQFFKKCKTRMPFFSATCAAIKCSGWDYNQLLRNNFLSIQKIEIVEPQIQSSLNKLLPLPATRLFPNEAVQRIHQLFHIKELTVINSDITVLTIDEAGHNTMTFDKLYATVTNISNDTLWMTESQPAEIRVETKFMNQSPLAVQIKLPLLAHAFNGTVTASIGQLSLPVLNPMINHRNINIKTGFLQKANIAFDIKNGWAQGDITLDYTDLEVIVKQKGTGKTRKVISKIANWAVKNENDSDEKSQAAVASSPVDYNRINGESFLTYLWHAAQSGLLPGLIPSYDKVKDRVDKYNRKHPAQH